VVTGGAARAADIGGAPEDPFSPFSLEVHGFASQGFLKSTANNYLAKSERGSFEFSEVGLNVTKRLTDRLRFGAQLFTRDLGPLGNYAARFDWYYLDYRVADWLGVRAGRLKLPFGLYNDINDIDAARVPILLPQSIYPATSRDYLLAQTGFELYGYKSGFAGALDYRLYAGTIFVEANNSLTATARIANIESPYVAGGRLLWETPLDGLRLGLSGQALRLDFDGVYSQDGIMQLIALGYVSPGFKGVIHFKYPAYLGVASAEYATGDVLLAAEYSIWRAKYTTDIMLNLPPMGERAYLSERMYGMGSYRLRTWLVVGGYYSLFFPRMDQRTPRQAHQHDFAATLRFDVNSYWIIKLEGHYMRGTAALDSALNGGAPLSSLDDSWLLFLLKTTIYF